MEGRIGLGLLSTVLLRRQKAQQQHLFLLQHIASSHWMVYSCVEKRNILTNLPQKAAEQGKKAFAYFLI
jgi:hypothetical protein